MRKTLLATVLLLSVLGIGMAAPKNIEGRASWYGEAYRGRPMANGERFDPDKLTAASWFYPLGTRVRVTIQSPPERSVFVTITDRGPSKKLVREGRIIDLARAAFEEIAEPKLGIVLVTVRHVRQFKDRLPQAPWADDLRKRGRRTG